ncbi:hypothetical protein GE061_016728 [Apolygus lucorum]|uniref:Uncharacterized protein n=1 Tax=Apolygus lucorum TaxID=248454 RepID=A0A6A4K0T1_APOLU|nr:hypothetical protein GE061_016728 [Apolygus lucorum]
MADKRMTMSFKSYIAFDEENLSSSYEDSFSEQLTPKLLHGESIIAEAQNVLMFANTSERTKGKSGLLFVTNFKLSFISADETPREEVSFEDTLQLGKNDVSLSNVDGLYLYGSDRKKKLVPDKNFSEKDVKGLYVVCKNMRMLSFSFKFSPKGHGKNLTNTLLHHAFPKRHQLLFAYDFREEIIGMKSQTNMFREPGDWGVEMARTGCRGWKLSSINFNFDISNTLPKWLVVPDVYDAKLKTASLHFNGGRPPLWCWSSPTGCSLVRMADLMPTVTDRSQENIMLEYVRTSHPKHSQPIIIDLTKDMPTPKDILWSFNKLRELCMPVCNSVGFVSRLIRSEKCVYSVTGGELEVMASSTMNHVFMKPFDGTNFGTWSYRMKLHLKKNKVLTALNEADAKTKQDEAWKTIDVAARDHIVKSLDDRIIDVIKDQKTACDMFGALERVYAKKGLAAQVSLQKKLRELRYTGGKLSVYLSEFEKTVSDLKECGGKVDDGEVICLILASMPLEYQAVTTTLDVLYDNDTNEISYEFVKNRLLQEFTKLNSASDLKVEETVAFSLRDRRSWNPRN